MGLPIVIPILHQLIPVKRADFFYLELEPEPEQKSTQ